MPDTIRSADTTGNIACFDIAGVCILLSVLSVCVGNMRDSFDSGQQASEIRFPKNRRAIIGGIEGFVEVDDALIGTAPENQRCIA